MRLLVMRHAPREPSEDFSEAEEGDPDAEITEEGRLIAKSVGDWLASEKEIPSRIFASPTVRTQQTADLVADAIEEAGYDRPEVETDDTIGPYMSIRGLVQKLAGDEDEGDALIVSHQQTIRSGLQALNVDAERGGKVDPHAAGELRILKVKRKSLKWFEKGRVRPSDLGGDFSDVY